MFLEPTLAFYEKKIDEEHKEERSFKFLFGYIKQYRKYFGQIVLGLLVGSLLQLILPFLTQSIVDVGIKNQNIGFIWLILLGQLMLTVSRTAIDFIRRWLLLHISLRINISLVSDFFINRGMTGTASILVSNESVLQRIIQRISPRFSTRLRTWMKCWKKHTCIKKLIFLIFN